MIAGAMDFMRQPACAALVLVQLLVDDGITSKTLWEIEREESYLCGQDRQTCIYSLLSKSILLRMDNEQKQIYNLIYHIK